MMGKIDELRPLSALRLLEIWRETQKAEPLERAILCNARVLAESCFYQDKAVFRNGEDVLAALTTREMETLLRRLGGQEPPGPAGVNPQFCPERFAALKGE